MTLCSFIQCTHEKGISIYKENCINTEFYFQGKKVPINYYTKPNQTKSDEQG